MLKGFNTDLELEDGLFHVQTEDWGYENPVLVSRIFRSGAVLKSVKTQYSDVLPPHRMTDQKLIKLAMKVQHKRILDLLIEGKLL